MRNTMLHIMNQFWLGGVPMFIRNMMQAYPEYHHVITFLGHGDSFKLEDYDMMQSFEWEFGCDIGHADGGRLSRRLVEDVDPAVLVLHCTSPKFIDGEYPWTWLKRWPSMMIHHMPTRPAFGLGLNVFVSNYVKRLYKDTLRRMPHWTVCPPVINAAEFTGIPRTENNERCVVGRVSSDWNADKYPPFYLDIIRQLSDKYAFAEFSIVGGDKHYPGTQIRGLTLPPVLSNTLTGMLADLDIFVYATAPKLKETFCRAVTEAMASGLPVVTQNQGGISDQITDGVDGFYCETVDEFVEKVSMLIESPALRYKMGMAAREKAVANFSLNRLRAELDPHILRMMVRGS